MTLVASIDRCSASHTRISHAARIGLDGWTISLGSCAIQAVAPPDLGIRLSVSDREGPLFTEVNGPLMARASPLETGRTGNPWPRPRRTLGWSSRGAAESVDAVPGAVASGTRCARSRITADCPVSLGIGADWASMRSELPGRLSASE